MARPAPQRPGAQLFPHALSPAGIGRLELAHRIVMGSMHLNLERGAGGGAAALAAFYRARVLGGADLVITGGAAVNRAGAGSTSYALANEAGSAGVLSRAVDAVRGAGGHIVLQLFHAGRYASERSFGIRPVAPSAVYSSLSRCEPEAMTAARIQDTIGDFAAAADRARGLGFDGVEIMASEGYLLNQFASPVTNRRDDEWGGDARRRQAFPLAVLRAVREAAGAQFPVIVRTSGADLVEGSSTEAELDELAVRFAAAGADALNVGIGWHESRVPTVQSMVPHGRWLGAARRVKRALRAAGETAPVIGSNRINSLPLAEAALAAGDLDLVSMARPFLADPDIIAKSRSGRLELVNTCIGCNEACLDRAVGLEPVSCLVNPRAGRELQFPRAVPGTRRSPAARVAVAGGGPAGLQAAAALAEAGVAVELFEAAGGLGGQFRLAGQVPGKADFLETIRYFEHELPRLGVRLRLGARAAAGDLQDYAHVVVATGVLPRRPALEGIGLPQVMDYRQAFAAPDRVGQAVAVIGGGGIAVDLAHLLAAASPQRSITIMRRSGRIGAGMGASTRWAAVQAVRAAGVRALTGVAYRRICPEGLWITNPSGKAELVPADTVIVAAGQEPCAPLAAGLAALGVPHTLVGGALDAGGLNAVRAVEQGLLAATAIARDLGLSAGG